MFDTNDQSVGSRSDDPFTHVQLSKHFISDEFSNSVSGTNKQGYQMRLEKALLIYKNRR